MFKLTGLFLIAMVVGGCSSAYRGIPSHGGGKRFSEEQRVVTGAMRQAIASMDLQELRGKRVLLKLTGIPSTGGGNINWGGVTANMNGSIRSSVTELNRVTAPNYRDDTENDSTSVGGSLSFRPNNNFFTSVQKTDADIDYLRAALEMKAFHESIRFTAQKPEVVLHVLVDVLGTNRSRSNWLVFHHDELKAECELSYYAINPSDQEFVFRSRRCSAEGVYSHTRCIVAPIKPSIKRRIASTVPTMLPAANGSELSIPENGDSHLDVEDKNPDEMDEEEKETYLKTMANQFRSQISDGKSREAREILQQIISVDPNYEELPALRDELTNPARERNR